MSARFPVHILFYLLFAINYGQASIPKVHIVYLGDRQQDDPKLITESHHELLGTILGSKKLASERMVYSYKHGFSGFAAKLTSSQAQELAEFPGVIRVIRNTIYRVQTTRSWEYLGLSTDSTTNLLQTSSLGNDVIIGVLDTGIWPESEAFNDRGLGPIPSRWKGECKSGEKFDPKTHCNRKIIGGRWFIDGLLAEYGQPLNTTEPPEYISPRDAIGHGTHVSSTAAASFVTNVSYNGLAQGTIRGGAPHARLAVYKTCWNVLGGGQCGSADILKAIDEAIHDGVDVLSLSLGSSAPLFSDVDVRNTVAIGSFHAVAKGITVVCAGGNDGPSGITVSNNSPWVLTVAASTMDRAFSTLITLGNNHTLTGESLFAGKEIGFTGIMYPEVEGLDPNAAGACESLSVNETLVAGKVVLCFTTLARNSAVTAAEESVKIAGGVGLIVAKNPNNIVSPCATKDFPCIQVDYEIGTKILLYIRSISSPRVKLSPSKTVVGKPISATVAYFTSRGPNSVAPEILKPDIAAPGVNILAATSPLDAKNVNGYSFMSGTSMATPHVSGIVALLKSLHPLWSPAAIKSALVTTAWNHGPSGVPIFADGSTKKLGDPFDYGGGIVNPNVAANPGLVYDMGIMDYLHYLCAMGYSNSAISLLTNKTTVCPTKKPSLLDLNLPSITIPRLQNSTTVTRTVTNVGKTRSIYRALIESPHGVKVNVKPNVLVFNSAIKRVSFKVTISTAQKIINTGYSFGSLTWTDGVHIVRIPLSVRTEILPSSVVSY